MAAGITLAFSLQRYGQLLANMRDLDGLFGVEGFGESFLVDFWVAKLLWALFYLFFFVLFFVIRFL